jgi:hypothetical protein
MTDEKSDEAIESEFIRVTGLTPAQALHEMYREALKIEKGFVLDGDFLSPQERAAVLRIKAAVKALPKDMYFQVSEYMWGLQFYKRGQTDKAISSFVGGFRCARAVKP